MKKVLHHAISPKQNQSTHACFWRPYSLAAVMNTNVLLFVISSVQNLSPSLCLRVRILTLTSGRKGSVQFILHEVVAVVKNGCCAWDLMSDVDVVFCLHDLLQEKLRTKLPQRPLPKKSKQMKNPVQAGNGLVLAHKVSN